MMTDSERRVGSGADQFFDESPLMALIAQRDGRIARANCAACEGLGYSEPELKEKTILELVCQDTAAAEATLAAMTERGALKSFDGLGRRKDGAAVRLRIHARRSADGELLYLNLLDITESWRREEELRSSEARLRSIVRHAPLAVIEFSPGGEICSWNPAAERIFGYSASEAVGRSARALIVAEGGPDHSEVVHAELVEHGHSLAALPNVTKDGVRIVCEWHFLVARDEGGNIVSAAAFAQDITARAEMEAQLRRSEQLLRVVLDHVPMVLWAVDEEGLFTHSDGLGLRALNLAPGQVVGASVFDLYRDFPGIVDLVKRSLAGEACRGIVEVGDAVWESRYLPLRDASGKQSGVVGLSLDVSERVRTEKELRERLAVIEAQRNAIRTMSMPIIQVWDDVLALPVIGVIDSHRAEQMMDMLLRAVVGVRAKHVIVDLTGVEDVDTSTADYLVRVVGALSLVGARVVVTGIQPNVASIVVALGIDLSGIVTARNLKDAIRLCTSKAA